MEDRDLLDIMATLERLKDTTRHCYTSQGRRESVAEHTWMLAMLAFFVQDEFPGVDLNKVIQMCLIHDLGEAFTGDIPTFLKTDQHRQVEDQRLSDWVQQLPVPYPDRLSALYQEMAAQATEEAKLYKALDKMEAVIQHNLSDIETWEPHEYDLNQVHGQDQAAFSPYLQRLRQTLKTDTLEKIQQHVEE